ncbi:MAG: NifB/NifX family molybdenum-iron cluster-binding protein [Candidatus Ratteibacteria bacterium]
MRIAIASDGNFVSAHFGRCPSYTIVDIENGKVIKKEVIENPGHKAGFIPQFLHQLGVECIICGGMGMRAKDYFDEYGIQTIVGINGSIDETIEKFLNNTLKGNENLCKPGSGKGYGINKSVCDHSEAERCEHEKEE